MKVRITFETVKQDYPSIRQAAIACGRGPRIISRLLHNGGEADSKLGKIIKVEAIDGKTEGSSSSVRADTHFAEENPSLGALAIRRGRGWIEQAMGKITRAVYGILSKFG